MKISLADKGVEGKQEPAGDPLVPNERRAGHEMLTVDDLVAFPVVGNEEIVLVGELGGGSLRSHQVLLSSSKSSSTARRSKGNSRCVTCQTASTSTLM
ncbi:MAG TPA: hypothetical protein VGX68_04465 [Thermoanaerobaculia bacterium]|jgi:hypothetical protein|nr:hypothetical protein [Thermoanaerobaculia bacterium]